MAIAEAVTRHAGAETPDLVTAPPRRRPVLTVALAVVIAAMLVLGVGGLVAMPEDSPTPDELLQRAQAFVKDEGSFAFRGRMRIEFRDTESSDSSFVQRGRLQGTTQLPNRSHYVVTDSESATEIITIGNKVYVRIADSRAELDKERYGLFDPDAEDARNGIVRPVPSDTEPERIGEPVNLLVMLRAARSPRVLRTVEDNTVIRADVDLDRAFGDASSELDRVTLDVTVTDDGRVDQVTVDVAAEGAEVSVDYGLSRWGAPAKVAAPADKDIDPTPAIDEEAVNNYKDAPLLAPRTVPAGWIMDGADVIPADETPEDCRQVELDYVDPTSEDSGYLWLYEMPASCGEARAPRGSEPFVAGAHRGWIRVDDFETTAEIVVGTTLIQVDTDLDEPELASVLSELVPLDFEAQPGVSVRPTSGGSA